MHVRFILSILLVIKFLLKNILYAESNDRFVKYDKTVLLVANPVTEYL
jgi:hypothetical protein